MRVATLKFVRDSWLYITESKKGGPRYRGLRYIPTYKNIDLFILINKVIVVDLKIKI